MTTRVQRIRCWLGFHDYRDQFGFEVPWLASPGYIGSRVYRCRFCGKAREPVPSEGLSEERGRPRREERYFTLRGINWGPKRLEAVLEERDELSAENEQLREALEASNELFEWIDANQPNGLVAAPTSIMRRLKRASKALHPAEETEGE